MIARLNNSSSKVRDRTKRLLIFFFTSMLLTRTYRSTCYIFDGILIRGHCVAVAIMLTVVVIKRAVAAVVDVDVLE